PCCRASGGRSTAASGWPCSGCCWRSTGSGCSSPSRGSRGKAGGPRAAAKGSAPPPRRRWVRQKTKPRGATPRLVPVRGVRSVRAEVLAELLQGLALDLPHPLPGQPEALADLLQRLRLLVVEAEPHPQHRRLALVHLVQEQHHVLQVVGLD